MKKNTPFRIKREAAFKCHFYVCTSVFTMIELFQWLSIVFHDAIPQGKHRIFKSEYIDRPETIGKQQQYNQK